MKRAFGGLVLAVFASTLCLDGVAAPQWCQGTVSNLWVYSDGTVYVYPSYRRDYTRVCNMNASVGGISVANCAAWFAMLRSAVQRRSSVLIYYAEAPVCGALPVLGDSPIPGYVMQVD